MISPIDVGVLDLNAEHLGINVSDLMENAGKALAEEIQKRDMKRKKVVFVLGTGNNGGDGLVAAKYLCLWKVPVEVVFLRPVSKIRTEISRRAIQNLPDDVVVNILGPGDTRSLIKASLKGAGIVVDGLLGSGAKGALKSDYAEAVKAMNSFKGKKIAIDSPSGLGHKISFKADLTVTFHDIKEGMIVDGTHHPDCGELVVRIIGIPQEAATYVGPGDLLRMPKKPKRSKKGENGKLLIIGGGPFTGAPALAGLAAVKAGADLVRLAVPRGVADVIASFSPDLIVERLPTLDPFRLGPEVLEHLTGSIEWCHAVLIGPGAGNDRGTLHLLKDVISHASSEGKNIVIDADGLTAVSELWGFYDTFDNAGELLLTPHRAELRRLVRSFVKGANTDILRDPYKTLGRRGKWKKEALETASDLAAELDTALLVKGPIDLVLSPDSPSLSSHVALETSSTTVYRRYCTAGVPAMSVGGTGDVLSGLCAGLIARGLSAFDAACVGSYLNGTAGEEAFSQVDHSLSATEVLKRIDLLPLR
jgi:NAD(P)H-hydrate epimerase